jgi:hypothetical protein
MRSQTLFAISLVVALAAACSTVDVRDELPPGLDKGYVEFLGYGQSITVTSGSADAMVSEGWAGANLQALRVARSPGDQHFWIKAASINSGYQTDFISLRVPVLKDRVTSVTVLGATTDLGSTLLCEYWSIGAIALPLNPSAADEEILGLALEDKDPGTRYRSLSAYRRFGIRPSPASGDRIAYIAAYDRYDFNRLAARKLLGGSKGDQPAEPFFFEPFTNNESNDAIAVPVYRWNLGKGIDEGDSAYSIVASGLSAISRDERLHWSRCALPPKGVEKLVDYDLECEVSWVEGATNAPYGIILGPASGDRVCACVAKGGSAAMFKVPSSSELSASMLVAWKDDAKAAIASESVSLRLEVRGAKVSYSVGGIPIGAVDLDAPLSLGVFGPALQGRETVVYRFIRIVER